MHEGDATNPPLQGLCIDRVSLWSRWDRRPGHGTQSVTQGLGLRLCCHHLGILNIGTVGPLFSLALGPELCSWSWVLGVEVPHSQMLRPCPWQKGLLLSFCGPDAGLENLVPVLHPHEATVKLARGPLLGIPTLLPSLFLHR